MVGRVHRPVDEGLVEDLGGPFLLTVSVGESLGPVGGGWDEGFGFTGNASAVPIGDGYEAGVAEAAESGSAVGQAELDAGCGHQVLQSIGGADGDFSFEGGERVHFLPEAHGTAKFALADAAQPHTLFAEHQGA